MVPRYEKYCGICEKTFRQDSTFWRDEPTADELFRNITLHARELRKDRLTIQSDGERIDPRKPPESG